MSAHILVIDDDDSCRGVVASTLSRLGYEISTAENGRVGLRMQAAEPADLVITDIFMPELDGIEVITALRAGAHPPKILAVSTEGVLFGMDALGMAKLLGVDATMGKPLSMSKLAKVVGELLDAADSAAA